MNLQKIFLCFILLWFSCTSSKKIVHYSRDNINQDNIVFLYHNIPVFTESREVKKHIIKLKLPKYQINKKSNNIPKAGIYQTLIDEIGTVEAIYINQSINFKLDSIIIEHIKKSEFKSSRNVWNKDSKYSLLLPLNFMNGNITSVLVNDKGEPNVIIPINSNSQEKTTIEFHHKSIKFNTYSWSWKPYMIHIENKIENNISPPPLFIYMGKIQGEIIIKFKIYPNGDFNDLEIISHTGHISLLETSIKAINNSAPFKPLPDDFPITYLEVTFKFSYIVNR